MWELFRIVNKLGNLPNQIQNVNEKLQFQQGTNFWSYNCLVIFIYIIYRNVYSVHTHTFIQITIECVQQKVMIPKKKKRNNVLKILVRVSIEMSLCFMFETHIHTHTTLKQTHTRTLRQTQTRHIKPNVQLIYVPLAQLKFAYYF